MDLQDAPPTDTTTTGPSPEPESNNVETDLKNAEPTAVESLFVSAPEAPEREKWETKTSYLLSMISYSVGFGNIWRFPYQMRENGGLAFLIPYFGMLALVGIPMFFLELAVGQRRRKGVVYAWAEMCPAFGGIGMACGWICFMVGLYYNTLIAYCISYFFDSFRSPLPWTDCKKAATVAGELNKQFQIECTDKLHERSTKYYWYRRTLDISTGYEDAGGYNWYLFLHLVIAWCTIYIVLVRGTKSIGAVAYVTAVLPYAVLLTFFIANCAIEPSKGWLGAYRLLTPNWSALYSPITWLKAGTQLFFSFGVASGCVVVLASYSPVRNNCYKDAITISLINVATSLSAALVIFPMIGLLGHHKYEECVTNMAKAITSSKLTASLTQDKYDIYFFTNAKEWSQVDSGSNNITIRYGYGELTAEDKQSYKRADYPEDILEEIGQSLLNQGFLAKAGPLDSFLQDCSIGQEATRSGGGSGLLFIGITEAVKHMPGSNFWSALWFLMLITLGFGSCFGTVEGAISTVQDITNKKRCITASVVCGMLTILAILLFPFGWGVLILDLLDQWTANWTFLVIALFECIAISWIHGLANWKYISPIVIVFMLVGSITQFICKAVKSGGVVEYTTFIPNHANATDGELTLSIPPFALTVGFLLMFLCIIWVPVHYLLRDTKWNILKAQQHADFPEVELREERHITVNREEDLFTDAEKVIIGKQNLVTLQKHRDKIKSETSIMHHHKLRKSSGASGALSITTI